MAMPPSWLPDWRDAPAYRFERLDRAGFAWEWLRRDPGYREAALAVGASVRPTELGNDAADWGLVRFEPPGLAAPHARSLWLAGANREVLSADIAVRDRADAGALRLDRLGGLLTLAAEEGATYLLLSDGWRRVRVDFYGPFDPSAPVLPRWRLAGVKVQPQLLALRRVASVVRAGQFPNRLWPNDPLARRWTLALRAHDALAAGAGHRELAGLLGAVSVEERWRVHESSLRLQAQRLAALARSLRGRAFADRYLAQN